MALASLTVDLVANLSKFEGDSGKAAQIIARDGEKMSSSQQKFLKSLERTAERMEGIGASSLRVRAAIVGVSDAAEVFLTRIDAAGGAAARAGTQGAAAFTALQSTVASSIASQKAGYSELADSINKVTAEANRLKAAAISDNKSGAISDDLLKTRLANISAGRADAVRQLQDAAAQQAAAKQLADVEVEATNRRTAAFQKLRDTVAKTNFQNDAKGAAEQAAASKALADAEESATNRRLAAFERLRESVAKSNYQQQIRDQKAQEEAARSLAAAEEASAQKRIAAFQRLRDTVAKANYDKSAADQAVAQTFADNVNARASAIKVAPDGKFSRKLESELLAERAAALGLSDSLAPAIKKLAEFEKATGQAGRSAFASRNQLLTLQYTISDVVASAGSGISPLTILLQQGGQVYDAFAGQGGIRAGISAVTGIFTPFRVAVLGGAGALISLGVAAFKGAEQTKVFNDAIALSGNFAGQTAGGFTALTRAIADSGAVTASSAREFGQALIATGEIGPQVFGQATEAATLYGQATGKTAKEVAQSFASMTRDVTKWTADNNRQLNLVTLAQFEQIKSLQEQGREAEAQAIVYDALTNRLKTLDSNLGILDRALRATKNGWASFWDAAFDIGRPETIEDRIGKASTALDALRRRQTAESGNPAFSSRPALRGEGNSIAAQEANLTDLAKKKLRQDDNAFAEADRAATNQAAIAFRTKLDGILAAGKTVAQKNKELAELERGFITSAAAGSPVNAAEQKAARDIIEKRYKQTSGSGRKDKEPDQILKAERDQALKEYENQLQAERAATDFQQKYLQGVYDAGAISLRDFYDKRRAVTETSLAAELSALEKSIGAEEAFIAKSKDPSDRIAAQTKINDFRDQQTAARIAGARSITLANQQEAASLKALNDRVIEYSAQLKQLEGDEAGAAAIRTKQAIENARLLSKASGGGVSEADIARQQKALELSNQLTEAQRQIGFISNRAAAQEQLFLLQAQNSALSLYDTERGLTEIRTRAAEQLRIQAEKLKEIADAAPDDQAKQEAATNAALQYAQAIDVADAALNRLRESAKTAAGGIAQTIGDSIVNFKGLGSVIDSIEKQLLNIGTKLLVTDPLTKGLEGILKGATEGDNPVGNFFKGVLGIGGGASGGGNVVGAASKATETAAITANIVATTTSTAALTALTAAATSAAFSLGAQGGASALGSITTASANAGSGSFISGAASFFSGFFADGGNIPAGKWGVVGENGPELAFGGSTGKNIVPMKRMGGGNGDGYRGGDRIVQQTINFSSQGSVDRRTQSQLAATTYRSAVVADMRNN